MASGPGLYRSSRPSEGGPHAAGNEQGDAGPAGQFGGERPGEADHRIVTIKLVGTAAAIRAAPPESDFSGEPERLVWRLKFRDQSPWLLLLEMARLGKEAG
jgi:hypothetical protein